MFKFLIVAVVAFFVIRLIYRGLQQTTPKSDATIELKACAYCGALVRVDKAIVVSDRIFCCIDHANRFV